MQNANGGEDDIDDDSGWSKNNDGSQMGRKRGRPLKQSGMMLHTSSTVFVVYNKVW